MIITDAEWEMIFEDMPKAHLRETVWNAGGSIPKGTMVSYEATKFHQNPFGPYTKDDDHAKIVTIYTKNISIVGVSRKKLFDPLANVPHVR